MRETERAVRKQRLETREQIRALQEIRDNKDATAAERLEAIKLIEALRKQEGV